ncbi:MAG: hypothetical protein GY792_01350 [Gammaproteobacteria bacterium]|nr:hypothetical protein [Gammaproteobacteria bacterium]
MATHIPSWYCRTTDYVVVADQAVVHNASGSLRCGLLNVKREVGEGIRARFDLDVVSERTVDACERAPRLSTRRAKTMSVPPTHRAGLLRTRCVPLPAAPAIPYARDLGSCGHCPAAECHR